MRRFGLIGYPLTHSFSQRYFTEKFEREGVKDCVYQNFPIEDISDLPSLLKQYPDLEGFNITIPYKEIVLPFLESRSDVVNEIKACNCVFVADQLLHGYNTDVVGFEQSLSSFIKKKPNGALILGTGGSSKAVAYVLSKLKIPFSFVSRNPTSQQLSYQQLNKEIIQNHRLIINTTPLGMYPVEKFPEIPYEFLGSDHYLFDLIYNPATTIFLQRGADQGTSIMNGSEMLVLQAEESWRIWNQRATGNWQLAKGH
jgi:shikimate dehydrogenase